MGVCSSLESSVRAVGGGSALDKVKDRMNDGVAIEYGKEKDVPEMACKGVGQARIGIKYKSKEGVRVDAEFAAIEFTKDGKKLDHATYNHTESSDGALKHLGDSTGADGAEFIAVKMGSLGEDVQAIVFCCYIFNDHPMAAFEEIKLVLKAAASDDHVVPIGHMLVDPKEDAKNFSGVTMCAIYRAAEGKWKAKNVYSEGMGPTNDHMIPACQKLFPELGIDPVSVRAAA
mmetsp:Transcript_892/g.2513  ORF Transcript_892/g.2513 Transcript_892/m.2513 type:complete len:230 (+) Transcript_892:79-768(+)|eukprot:CAMPEP_0198643764 /NCGR_PEP_ID=MMETSP1467-20131203/47_1 /TAXON_ID=1462469 /ORGANISM="unid. sp., Strain CCMP2135" /LENGTH=229 /DNA_ID=CAMNT_0044379175 /DNA_START=63 /DNA_END=752 /DNA_ORIENTATION=-